MPRNGCVGRREFEAQKLNYLFSWAGSDEGGAFGDDKVDLARKRTALFFNLVLAFFHRSVEWSINDYPKS